MMEIRIRHIHVAKPLECHDEYDGIDGEKGGVMIEYVGGCEGYVGIECGEGEDRRGKIGGIGESAVSEVHC